MEWVRALTSATLNQFHSPSELIGKMVESWTQRSRAGGFVVGLREGPAV